MSQADTVLESSHGLHALSDERGGGSIVSARMDESLAIRSMRLIKNGPNGESASIDALGSVVRIGLGGRLSYSQLVQLLEPWRDALSHPDGSGSLEVEVEPVESSDFERVASMLSTQITLAALAKNAGSHLMLHAGGIARDDGSVAAIIGPSGRGKTTTIRHLSRYFGYVSDEAIAITSDGAVVPYRKPLSVITDGYRHKQQVAPSDLGLCPLPDADLRIARLALLKRSEDGVAESRVEQVPLAEAIAELVPETSYLVELSNPLRRIAEVVEMTGGVLRLTAGYPERIIEIAEQLFEPGQYEPWRQVLPKKEARLSYHPSHRVLDAIECTDGTVVLTSDRQLHVLAGAGPVVWSGLCEGDSWDVLEERARNELGEPPTGTLSEALLAVCEDLVEAGVVQRRA